MRVYGCLLDMGNDGLAVDAGLIELHPSGAAVVYHGGGSEHCSPYLPNANRAVLMVPPISWN